MRRALLALLALLLLVGVADARTRSRAVRRAFLAATGYPHGRPGYVVDHIIPLACGGADAIGNLQWQTVADAKAKDRWERRDCHPNPVRRKPADAATQQ